MAADSASPVDSAPSTDSKSIPLPDWLAAGPIQRLLEILPGSRFVGGAVRDTLLGRQIGDLDLATPLPPDEVIQRLTRAGIRSIPTGIAHGTVTALLKIGPVEVTTLRRDVETFGRQARVAYTTDWAEDAARRDFTMNALYLDGEGALYDPVHGRDDCVAGRVHFVGEPARRITEDYLRILRFYRFLAHYGRGEPDSPAREACRLGLPGLDRLASERVGAEIFKLLAAPDPVAAIRLLIEDGVWHALFGISTADLPHLQQLLPIEPAPDPLRRIAALLPPQADRPAIAARLSLPNRDRDRLVALGEQHAPLLDKDRIGRRRDLWEMGADLYRDRALLEAATGDSSSNFLGAALAAASKWSAPILPIGGSDLLALGIPKGPRIGQLLKQIESWWIDGDFQAEKPDCLQKLQELLGAP